MIDDFWIICWPLCYHDFCPYSNHDILILSSANYIKMCDRYNLVLHKKRLKYKKTTDKPSHVTNQVMWNVYPSSINGFQKTIIFFINSFIFTKNHIQCGSASSRSKKEHIIVNFRILFSFCGLCFFCSTVLQLSCLFISFQKIRKINSILRTAVLFLLLYGSACICMSSFYWFSSVSLIQFLLIDHLNSFLCISSPRILTKINQYLNRVSISSFKIVKYSHH